MCGPKKVLVFVSCNARNCILTAKAVEGAALAFEGVDNIHGSDSLPLSMLGVGDGVADNVLKEDLEDTTGLFIDETRDTLDTSTTSKTTDGRLGDTLDIITQHLTVTLGAPLSEPLASFTTSSHDDYVWLQYFFPRG